MNISMKGTTTMLLLLILSACNGTQLFQNTSLKPGSAECEAGGNKLEWGNDTDKDGKLNGKEILGSSISCNVPLLVRSVKIEPGESSCARGGIKVIYGFDNDNDTVIDVVQDEIIHCNEHDYLIKDQSIAVGSTSCPFGGVLLIFGHDLNGNNSLEANEVENQRPICQQRVDGFSNLINVSIEAAGAHCRSGGQKFQTGLDLDQDLVLDTNEVNYESYVCNGDTSLINVETLTPGPICETGGIIVHSGLDDNANRVLDTAEYDFSSPICSGRTSLLRVNSVQPGALCVQGGIKIEGGFDRNANGTLNDNEVDHTNLICNGVDGYTSLVKLTEIPINLQSPCQFGGTQIDSGLDLNRNRILETNEILHTNQVCKVQVNQNQNLISFEVTHPEDLLCQYGGIVTKVGLDANNDRILQVSEVTNTSVNCNQVMIVDGKTSLTRSRLAGTTVCAFGGFYFDAGIDDNRDGSLSNLEVNFTQVVCNGNNGYNSLTSSASYAGTPCGATGGQRVTTGLDMNRNNVLESTEVQNTSFVCNGIDGQPGYSALVDTLTYSGIECSTGGLEVRTGLDLNRDGILQTTEIQKRKYVCNGLDGFDGAPALVKATEGSYMTCGGPGVFLQTGTDYNYNGILESAEVNSTSYVCDGINGFDGLAGADALVKTTGGFFSDCAGEWGVKIETGTDWDFDHILDATEITSGSIVCELAPAAP